MKRFIALLLITACAFASDKDKGGNNKNNDKGGNKGNYDCGKHLERRGFIPSEASQLCDHRKSSNNSGTKSHNSSNSSSNRRTHGDSKN